ncbi:TRM11 family SAM-dependent methyltransferase [Amycolatopsis palatopharyngis]|uniref:TRM11 family SAM-dependent methyltransferase n=1 Tax=Amycolatopsis palatopharyngis TaxID=187982 RepID=UPI000E2329FD|nr:SAM-dependent methyltransferase [Amycolatopsis palatopharyngis]
MPEYAILILPAANRVYHDVSPRLLRAELEILGDTALSQPVTEIEQREIAGTEYVTFATEHPLTEDDVAHLSDLSSMYVLFEVAGALLRPIRTSPLAWFDSDLLTIQKYPGKTNELFTKLLLNITLLAAGRATTLRDAPAHVLDPLCGRGTTLNHAMMYGCDATGFEVDGRDFEAYEQFVKTWLRTKRVKHSAEAGAVRRNKVRLGRKLDIEFGLTKERYKAGETRSLTYYNCDTLTIDQLLKRDSVDVIVTDAPYGVQHGSRAAGSGPVRSPRELLAAAVPGWTRVLRPGGAIGISWNTNVAKREELTEILAGAGLRVRAGGPYDQLEHRVDQAILRDLIVAVKEVPHEGRGETHRDQSAR